MANRNKWLTVSSITCFFMAIFLTLSLSTYSPATDPPTHSSSVINNAAGAIGAYLSHYLYLGMGYLSWLLVGALVLIAMDLYQERLRFFSRSAGSGFLLVYLGTAGSIAYWGTSYSGLLGMYLKDRLNPILGSAGSLLFFGFIVILGIILGAGPTLRDALGDLLSDLSKLTEYLSGGKFNLSKYTEPLISRFRSVTGAIAGLLNSSTGTETPQQSPASLGPSETVSKREPSTKTDDSEQAKTKEDSVSDEKDESSDEESSSDNSVLSFDKNKSKSNGVEESDVTTEDDDDVEKEAVEVEEERPEVDEADLSHYKFPPLSLLDTGNIDETVPSEEDLKERSELLEDTFEEFGLEGEVVGVRPGPVLTMFEVEPGPGVSVKKFQKKVEDIKLNLAVESVRIVSPIPGKSALGIEVPNSDRATVKLRDLLETSAFQQGDRDLPIAIGMDVHGDIIVEDLAGMPHLLVAGATGSGKSVCLNAIISSLLYKRRPDLLKFIMIDPKRVEFSLYEDLPHLMTPVIDDSSEATKIFKWAVREMENRYEKLSEKGVKNLKQYNDQVPEDEELPYLVIVVDEMADLMMSNPKECEKAIVRIAQKARATGIHMILATQRPDKDVITGLIKANMPARISFKVINKTNSRIILDQNGAETLMGNGDLLYMAGGNQPQRAQGSFVSAEETKEIVKYVKEQLKPSYVDKEDLFGSSSGGNLQETMDDEHYEDAKELVIERQKASASMIQRRFRVGYNRAARMVEAMEEEGIVGPHRGSKARNVLVDKSEYFDEEQQNGE